MDLSPALEDLAQTEKAALYEGVRKNELAAATLGFSKSAIFICGFKQILCCFMRHHEVNQWHHQVSYKRMDGCRKILGV